MKEISVAVPQSSVLGPTIFNNVFMNYLVYAVKQSRLSVYADDTQIVLAGRESGGGNKCGSRKCWSTSGTVHV